MKKIILYFGMLTVGIGAVAQSRTEGKILLAQVLAEAQFIEKSLKIPSSEPQYLQWFRGTITDERGKGIYFEFTQNKTYFSAGGGIALSKLLNERWRFEGGIGPEINFTKQTKPMFVVAGNMFSSIESKPGFPRAQGKFEASLNLYCSKQYGGWYSFSAILSPVKWLGVGIFSQANAVGLSPIVRLQLPLFRPWISWNKNFFAIGGNFYGSQFVRKSRR